MVCPKTFKHQQQNNLQNKIQQHNASLLAVGHASFAVQFFHFLRSFLHLQEQSGWINFWAPRKSSKKRGQSQQSCHPSKKHQRFSMTSIQWCIYFWWQFQAYRVVHLFMVNLPQADMTSKRLNPLRWFSAFGCFFGFAGRRRMASLGRQGMPCLSELRFHKGIPGIQTTNPNHTW